MSDMDRQTRESDVEPVAARAEMNGPDSGQVVHAMLARGVSDPAAYARYIQSYPQQRDAVLAMLNRSLGNSFVAQVGRLLGQGHAPSGAAMAGAMDDFRAVNDEPGRGHAPSAETMAGPMADFHAVNDEPAKVPGQGHAPSAETMAGPMADFHEVNDAPAKHGLSADEMQDFRDINEPSASGQGHAPSAEAMAETMADFRAVNEGPTKPSPEVLNDAIEDFREVNGDGPSVASSQVEIGASSEVKQPAIEEQELSAPAAKSATALGPVRVTASALHVRSSGDSSSKDNILGMLHRGDVVTAVGHEGSWLKIEYRGKTAFIHGDYAAPVGKRKELDATPGPVHDDND